MNKPKEKKILQINDSYHKYSVIIIIIFKYICMNLKTFITLKYEHIFNRIHYVST